MHPVNPDPHSLDWYEPRPAVMVPRRRRIPLIHIVLFTVTFCTTAMAGAFQMGADPIANPASIRAGFPFAITLMTILLVHELGHYFLSQYHGVRATLPYFIPAPPFLVGTFGAFIRMQSPPRTRRALFDVGAAGPWAGMIMAIPAIVVGLLLSEVRPLASGEGGLILGDSLLFSWLTRLTLGVAPDNATILLHPIAMAGWFGFFVTFLNLLPVGQLDGGHVAYAMFGRAHRLISRFFVGVILLMGFGGWQGWFVWSILLVLLGMDHPPTVDAETPLDGKRTVASWLTVGVFALTFMRTPIAFVDPPPRFEGDITPVSTLTATPAPRPHGLVIPLGRRPTLGRLPV